MKRTLMIAVAFVLGGTSLATAALGRGDGAESFGAAFEARAVGDPSITSCPGLGPDGTKIEARYEGTFAIPAQERRLTARFSLEIVLDRSTGAGTAEGTWRLVDPPDPDIVGRGELVAVVTAGDPPSEVDPPDPDLELDGMVTGAVSPPDPDMPAQRLLGNFTASLDDGATFPHLKGTVGASSVVDATGLATNPAVLIPAVKC